MRHHPWKNIEQMFRIAFIAATVVAPLIGQTRPVVVDGSFAEPLWREVAAERLVPEENGVPADTGGEVRAIVAGRYLCVAAVLPEPTGRFVARLTGRNPNWEQEDGLRVLVGANIGYTDRIVQINPLGAYSIEKAVHVPYKSVPVFPYSDEWERAVLYRDADKFLVAVSRSAGEWRAEVAIPLNQLSAPGSDRIFVRVERVRAPRVGSPQQQWYWPRLGPAARVSVAKNVRWDASPPLLQAPEIGNPDPPLTVGRRSSLPPLNSPWDDPAWTDVPSLPLLRNESNPRPARFPVSVKMLQDGRTLAVIARCIEPDRIVTKVSENDGPLGQDDSFHVYLSSSGSSYVQYAANAAGYLLDTMGFAGGQRLSRARSWNSGAQVSVHRRPGSWDVRLDIPLDSAAAALGETALPAEWRVLLLRYRPARDGEPREISELPVTNSETALCPARYRRIVFTNRESVGTGEASPVSGAFDTRVFSASQRAELNLAGMLQAQLRGRVLKVLEDEKREREGIRTREDWERFRDERIRALAGAMGPVPERTPLHTRILKTFAGEGYQRQDLVYESRPGLWVTANLYLPSTPKPSIPGIVIVHSLHRPKSQAELQDMGILWARAGCAVLVMDQIGHGERMETYPWNREAYHSRYTTGMQLSIAGESLMKWMVRDIRRGIDLVASLPVVNREQIILLGAVAGGGDPAAVTAALDSRVAAVVPFNFGEASPEQGGGKSSWPAGFADPGWGSWESTRNLPGSIAHQFLPWIINASVAPRRFLYSYELGWDVRETTAWSRYQKIFRLFDAENNLGEAHGFGDFPGPGECANIGPAQRQTIYPYLKRWFNIPAPTQEPDDRRPESELQCLTPATAASLKMRSIHEFASQMAEAKIAEVRAGLEKMSGEERRNWLQKRWAAKLGDIVPNPSSKVTAHWKRPWRNATAEALALETEPGILVPLILLHPSGPPGRRPLVIAVAERGKEGFLNDRAGEIEALLHAGFEIALPDLRGTGETSPDTRRDPSSQEISLAATEQMLDNTLLGARLKDLRSVIAFLKTRPEASPDRIAVWGDSFAPANASSRMVDETAGWRVGPTIQYDAEPLGGLMAILAALYENSLRAVVIRGGLSDYASILKDAFPYIPADVVIPGIADAGDLPDVMAAIAPRPLWLQGTIDGKNRPMDDKTMRETLAIVYARYSKSPGNLNIPAGKHSEFADWLRLRLTH
jgi:cephalosporin-C deacetylase-like acetyl esterase